MKQTFWNNRIYVLALLVFCKIISANAQTNQSGVNGVTTYMNNIMGDHADQTMMRVGNDFYTTASSFHYNPFLPILHSTDLVRWEVIAHAVPSNWAALGSDATSAGTWQGALAQFGGFFWVYFSNNAGGGQYFTKASAMAGPWSTPVKVTGSTVTGYDNSIFVDDDGTPYMLMKMGKAINRIQKLDKISGQVTGALMNMDWVNANDIYSWAEGPVMCKHNGRYYYFVAGNVSGGQYVLSSPTLSADESSWTRHGNFFSSGSSAGGFTGPNHITQPIKLDDGTWWCLSHAYNTNGWRGQGRLGMLHQVIFDGNGVPKGVPASINPVAAPNLPNTKNIMVYAPREDYFTTANRNLHWLFFNKKMASQYSLTANPGNMRLTPGTGTTHIFQKEYGHYYTMITKVIVNATANGQSAGLRIQNGKDELFATMYSGYNGGSKKIGFAFNGVATEVNNTIGSTVWLKIDREEHFIKGYYSADGKAWTQVGAAINLSTLDNFDTNYNEWVGTAIGLYATAVVGDFDCFKYRDGFSALKVAGNNNKFGITTSTKTPGLVVSNSNSGDWAMLAGVSMGQDAVAATTFSVNAASASGTGSLEVWIDNIGGQGTKIAHIPITASGGADVWKNYSASVTVKGQHDLYLKFIGTAGAFSLNSVRFAIDEGSPVVHISAPVPNAVYAVNAPIVINATATSTVGTISKVEFFNGTTLIGSDNTSPYSITWNPAGAGVYSITAKATDNSNKTSISSDVFVIVKAAQSPYSGKAAAIPGTIQFEHFDEGGQDSAYYDTTAGSETGNAFRAGTDVDIEDCTDVGAGYNLGFTAAGEWLEYTVNVASAGMYNLVIRAACNGDGRTVSLSANGVSIAKDLAIPNTGDWQGWEDVALNAVRLEAGKQIIRITIGAVDFVNLNHMTFSASSILPAVKITAPTKGSSFNTSQIINLAADATSSDGSIASVTFYANTTLLATLTAAPYTFDWLAMSASNYTVIAEATDNKGAKSYDTVYVSVSQAPVSIPLKVGWNLVGFPYMASADIAVALSSVWDNVKTVKNSEAFYDKSQPAFLNSLSRLEWGAGYYVWITKDCDLIWVR